MILFKVEVREQGSIDYAFGKEQAVSLASKKIGGIKYPIEVRIYPAACSGCGDLLCDKNIGGIVETVDGIYEPFCKDHLTS